MFDVADLVQIKAVLFFNLPLLIMLLSLKIKLFKEGTCDKKVS